MAVLWLIQEPGLTVHKDPRGGPEQVGKQGLADPPEGGLTTFPCLLEPMEKANLGLRQEHAHPGQHFLSTHSLPSNCAQR